MTTITDSPLVNSQMKLLSSGLSYLGCNSPMLKIFLESGACGVMPAIATVEDLSHLIDRVSKNSKEPSTSNKLIMASLLTEVSFDCFEVASSVGEFFQISFLQSLTENVSDSATKIRFIGGIILATCSIDEARTQYGLTSFLGSTLDAKVPLSEKISSLLRAGEVAAATVSNGFLLIGGDYLGIHKTASLISNGLKGARFIHGIFSRAFA